MKHQYFNNTKIGQMLAKNILAVTEQESFTQVEASSKAINFVSLQSMDTLSLSSTNISPFDVALMDAIYSISLDQEDQQETYFTEEMVMRKLSGNETGRTSKEKREEIRNALEKLSAIRIVINCENEKAAQKTDNALQCTYRSYLLPLESVHFKHKVNGKEVMAYHLLKKPALYQYAEALNQIIDVPESYLQTQDKFNDTTEAVVIKRYVIKRIAQMMAENRLKSTRISYFWTRKDGSIAGMYKELGYDFQNETRDKKKKINKVVKGTLETLVQLGAIKGFEAYRIGDETNPKVPIAGYTVLF